VKLGCLWQKFRPEVSCLQKFVMVATSVGMEIIFFHDVIGIFFHTRAPNTYVTRSRNCLTGSAIKGLVFLFGRVGTLWRFSLQVSDGGSKKRKRPKEPERFQSVRLAIGLRSGRFGERCSTAVEVSQSYRTPEVRFTIG
jgi:hypothetical protein